MQKNLTLESELVLARQRGTHFKGKYEFLKKQTQQIENSLDETCSQRDLLLAQNAELRGKLDAAVAFQESQAESIRRFEEQTALLRNFIVQSDTKVIELQSQVDYWMALTARSVDYKERHDYLYDCVKLSQYLRIRPWQEDNRLKAHLAKVTAENLTVIPGKIKIMSADRSEVISMVFKDAIQVLHNMENAKPMKTPFPESHIATIVEACQPLISHASTILEALKDLLGS